MRRFQADHETLIPDDSVLAYWKMDEHTVGAYVDSAYTGTFVLGRTGTGFLTGGLFAGSGATPAGARGGTAGTGYWATQGGSGGVSQLLCGDWSVSLWGQLTVAGVTSAWIEYCQNQVASLDNCMPLGIYTTASGFVQVVTDLSATSVRHTHEFNVQIPTTLSVPFHLAVTKTAITTNMATVNVALNGVVLDTSTMFFAPFTAGYGTNSGFILGASAKNASGVAASSPAFATNSPIMDDVAVWTHCIQPEKIQDIYRSGVRTWHEKRMFETGSYVTRYRVKIADANGKLVDLTDLYGVDWVKTVDLHETVEDPVNTANIKLLRFKATALNLSPLSNQSILNLDINQNFAALIDLRRRIKVEVAVTPVDWKLQGWEYELRFDGFVDDVDWQDDSVTLSCLDRMAPMRDQFQVDPITHDYYSAPTLAETHIQTVINENIPTLLTGTSTLVFGYFGGTPTLYTPASTGWVLTYDDSPSGSVDGLVQAVADQIGWDCRWMWYDPWQEYRLTMYAPNRALSQDIVSATSVGGFTQIKTTIPHKLVEEQQITIGTVPFTVSGVQSAIKFTLDSTASIGPGTFTYTSVATIPDGRVRSYDALKKTTENIRNACIVKYSRNVDTATFPLISLTGTVGNPLTITFPSSVSFAGIMPYLVPAQPFTITDSNASLGVGNGDWTIGTLAGNVITTNETLGLNVTGGTSAAFKSDYITFKQTFACNTVSIGRYGLRQAAILESSTGNIDTEQEALALATAVVNDLADPTADTSIKLPTAPWFELHDVITLQPDVKQRWTQSLQMAIVTIDLHLEREASYTQLALRNSAPTLGTVWVGRIKAKAGLATYPVKNFTETDDTSTAPGFKNNRGHNLAGKHAPMTQIRGGHRRLRHDSLEIHIINSQSTTASTNFIPTANTLVQVTRDNLFDVHLESNGQPITPGVPYYMKFRPRDVFGNMPLPSPATAVVARFTDKPAAAKVFNDTAGISSQQFKVGGWSPYPFTQSSTSPAFDNFNNFTLAPTSNTTLPYLGSVGTGAFFRMPCDGVCVVDARLGFSMITASFKPVIPIAVGLFRIGSSLRGSNASLPLVFKGTGPAENLVISPFTALFVGTGASVLFVPLSGSVSAHSGDYIQIGVWPDWTTTAIGGSVSPSGVGPAKGTTTSSGSTSWASFRVVSQD